jgi:O-antigen/teichoic acid export membrane protein
MPQTSRHTRSRPDPGPAIPAQAVTRHLTSGPVLARSTLWSFAGQLAPALIALFAVPPLLRGLGIDRFGVLSLAWTVVGYFGLFDLGLGWALTRVLSERLSTGREEELPGLIWTSLALLVGLGLVGAICLALLSPLLVHVLLRVPAPMVSETLSAFRIIACALPAVIGGAGLTGVLAAHQRFGMISAVRIPLAALSYLGPLIVLAFSTSLVPLVSVIVATRYVGSGVTLALCLRVVRGLRRVVQPRLALLAPLLRLGGWITVTNLVGPLMVNLDRFLIGALLTLAAVSYYATPFDLVSRIWLLSGPVVAVLFPALASSHAVDRPRAARLFQHGLRFVFAVLFPSALAIATLAPQGLRLWLGPEFAAQSTRPLQILAVGMFVNGLAHLALAVVQGVGRPSWAGRLHLVELPLYLAGAWWLVRTRGIEGAAIAWTVRATIDSVALLAKACSLLEIERVAVRRAVWVLAGAMIAFPLGCLLGPLSLKAAFLAVVLGVHTVFVWRYVVEPGRDVMAGALNRAARLR